MTPFNDSWTLFLDRDGVINERLPGAYVREWSEFHFFPGNLEALSRLGQIFGRIIVVTNQQGIGKGLMTEEELERVHINMRAIIEAWGSHIDGIYHCPDLKTKPNNCRKPNPDMALQAKADFPEIDFEKSVMVGDSLSDLEFGNNLAMTTIWIENKTDELEKIRKAIAGGYVKAHHRYPSLATWAHTL
jgi:D-glycero-D-manno-heptose 1,7-bisphosphate phosphatase